MSAFNIALVGWEEKQQQLRQIRERVFMDEQKVPAELEWDGEDNNAIHLLASDANGDPIACARILRNGHIGRMAVLPSWRRRGVGRALLRRAIDVVASLGCDYAFLDAQLHALPFYRQEGFVEQGEVFMDAGIPHRHMRRKV